MMKKADKHLSIYLSEECILNGECEVIMHFCTLKSHASRMLSPCKINVLWVWSQWGAMRWKYHH